MKTQNMPRKFYTAVPKKYTNNLPAKLFEKGESTKSLAELWGIQPVYTGLVLRRRKNVE